MRDTKKTLGGFFDGKCYVFNGKTWGKYREKTFKDVEKPWGSRRRIVYKGLIFHIKT